MIYPRAAPLLGLGAAARHSYSQHKLCYNQYSGFPELPWKVTALASRMEPKTLTYADAGVDIERANRTKQRIDSAQHIPEIS